MAETAHDRQFTDLAPAPGSNAAILGRVLGRPMAAALLSVLALAALGWLSLGLLAAAMPEGHFAGGLIEAICWPTFGRVSPAQRGLPWSLGWHDALVLLMWCAMALAMMLPTAGPMILTYAEIADAAARKRERVVSPLALAAGYIAVWLGFALIATVLQAALTRAALLDPAMRSVSPLFSGAVFLAAGFYQFSALKHACVTRCQRPFPFFFANWTDKTAGVFRLGLRQGRDCLGCCWALMLVMFAVGVMNVVWMAGLGLVMGAEKIATTTRFSRLVGVALIAIGAAFVVPAVVSHWPGR
jgi:predicted metal-binding membrane protein